MGEEMPERWRAEFLAKNGRAALREAGIPLFRFRCSNDEYTALRAELSEALAQRPIHEQAQSFFPSFVFYASEWFRRREHEGPWEWNSIATSLGSREPLRLDQALYDLLEIGFQWWRRPVTQYEGKRRFLWSIVREGGLPLGRLVGERVHSLRLVLGALVEKAVLSGRGDLHRYAARLAERLPVMLQDESILGTLAEFAWWLASNRELLLSGDEAAIIDDERLQANLPFDLSQDRARVVAEALVAESLQAVRRSIPRDITERFLLKRHEGGAWTISRWFRLPRRTTAKALRLERPAFCRLYLQDALGRYASVADCAPSGDEEVELHAARLDLRCPPELGLGPLHVVAIADGRELGRLSFQGGSDVPWVFRPREEDPDEFILEGEGSLRRSAPVLVAAGPKDFEPTAESGHGAVRELGMAEDRRLFELTGTVVFTRGIDRCLVEAGQANQSGGLPVSVESASMLDGAFIGVPRVTAGGYSLRLLWRPDRVVGLPIELTPQSPCSGAGWLTATDTLGHVLYRRHVRMLPASTRVAPSGPGVQELRFTGLGRGATIALVSNAPTTRRVIPDGFAFGGLPGDPGDLLEFRIAWPDGSALTIRVPKPGRSARFLSSDGAPLSGDKVPLTRLGRIEAVAWVPDSRVADVQLHARLHQRWNPSFKQVPQLALQLERRLQPVDGVYKLPLVTLKDDIDLMFASTTSHEAYVELTIRGGGGGPMPRLNVERYEGVLEPCLSGVGLTLPPDADLNPAEVDVFLQPFGEPRGARERLPYLGDRRWKVDESQRGSGALLATGWSNGVCRFRPLRLSASAPPIVPMRPGSLGAAVEESDPTRRANAFLPVFDRLSANWNDPDWISLTGFLDSLRELPVTTYDVVVQLVQHSRLCAATVLRSPKADLPRVTQALEELLFMWHLVPVTAWRAALEARQAWLSLRRNLLGEPPASRADERADLLAELRQLGALMPAYPVLPAVLRLAGEDLKWLESERQVGKFEEVCQLAWDEFLRGSNDTAGELNVPSCPHPWPNRVRPKEVMALLEVPSRIEALANHNASLRDLYLAPRLAALFALTGQAATPPQVLALRQTRGATGVRAQYFDAVYLAVLNERLGNEAVAYWSK